jgi:signal transduction histidine kinase
VPIHRSEDDNELPARPAMAAEVRAWMVVAGTFVLNLVVVVYWAATLSADIKNLQYQVADFKNGAADRYSNTQATKDFTEVFRQLSDHESRIRAIERNK